MPVMARLLPLIVLGTALTSVANITLTRNMSADEYGAFPFFLSTINLMSLVGLLGFQQTLPHFLSRYERERKPDLRLGFMIAILLLVAMGLAAGVCLLIQGVWIAVKGKSEIRGIRPHFQIKTWLLGSLPVGGGALLSVLIYVADVIAVRLMSGSASAAASAVASSLASFVLVPRKAITRYFSQEAPHVAGAVRSASLQRLIRKVLGFHLLCVAAIGVFILFLNQARHGQCSRPGRRRQTRCPSAPLHGSSAGTSASSSSISRSHKANSAVWSKDPVKSRRR